VLYTKHPQNKGKGKDRMEATPEYVSDILEQMRRVWNPETGEWLVPEDWISDGRMPDPIAPTEVTDAAEAAETVSYYLRSLWLARQAGQEVCLELRRESRT
jgi:hypothetical protein